MYRCEHNCEKIECKKLTAHIRIEGKWARIGHYGSECKKFEAIDVLKEEQDAEKRAKIDAEIRRVKQEGRERLKTIQNEFNMNNSFFN